MFFYIKFYGTQKVNSYISTSLNISEMICSPNWAKEAININFLRLITYDCMVSNIISMSPRDAVNSDQLSVERVRLDIVSDTFEQSKVVAT